jgi:hypothetical protein
MHAGSLQIRWLTFSGENWAVSYPYSLGNIIQFHELLSDPKDLDLTRHEGRMVKVIACIEDPVVIEKILSHLSEKASSTETTLLPESRAPPHAGLYD